MYMNNQSKTLGTELHIYWVGDVTDWEEIRTFEYRTRTNSYSYWASGHSTHSRKLPHQILKLHYHSNTVSSTRYILLFRHNSLPNPTT